MSREVEIVITPSEAEYRQLSKDLATLRERGAKSNTAAVVEAVHEQARRARLRPVNDDRRRAA